MNDLSRLVEKFVNEVLLCPKCGLPEICIDIQKQNVCGKCRACGGNDKLKIKNDKFRKYILNHPPLRIKGATFEVNQSIIKKVEDSNQEPENDEIAKMAEEALKNKKNLKGDEKEDDVIWFTDTSKEAVKKRRELLLPESMLKKQIKTDQLKDFIDDFEKLKLFKIKEKVLDSDWIPLLFDTMFGNSFDLKQDIEKYKHILKKFIQNDSDQIQLLICFEENASKNIELSKKQFPLILKDLYDADILEENLIIQWFDEIIKIESVKNVAFPFVKWLKQN